MARPKSHKVQTVHCSASTAGQVSLTQGPEHIYFLGGQVLLDFYEHDAGQVVLIDADAGTALMTSLKNTAFIWGRWSNYYAPSLLFPSSEVKGSRRRWYAVKTEISQSEDRERFNLAQILLERPRHEPDRTDLNSDHLRLLPNWLHNEDRGVYIGGVKRLLTFLTEE